MAVSGLFFLLYGVFRSFVTDDNFARNKNWEPIFDRIIELRENEGMKVTFMIQVDTLCHKIPNFVEKAARAGCKQVFIGLENINPVNLKVAKKRQNRITEYRKMLQAWRNVGIITYCGYILGFPDDTPESIERDIDNFAFCQSQLNSSLNEPKRSEVLHCRETRLGLKDAFKMKRRLVSDLGQIRQRELALMILPDKT